MIASPGENRTQLRPLTSLRFFAALLVFCWHAGWTKNVAAAHFLGPAGVEFFFVLSGFILTYTYRSVFARGLTSTAMRAFWVARFARVYPLYALSLAASVAVGAAGYLPDAFPPHGFWPILGAHVVLVQTWDLAHMGIAFRLNRVDWSISDEALFYALFPLLAWLLLRRSREISSLLLGAAGLTAIAVILNVLLWPHVDERIPYVFPPVRVADFAVGMLLAAAFVRGLRVRRSPVATLAEIATLCGCAGAIATLPLLGTSTAVGPYFLPFSGLVVTLFACEAGAVSRALSHPILVYLGEISFALYLVHVLVLAFVPSASPLQFALAGGASLAVAAFAHELFEKPLRDGIRARLAQR
jgi:peptidoglycan/LPS O-acetylase OafA/YrhL